MGVRKATIGLAGAPRRGLASWLRHRRLAGPKVLRALACAHPKATFVEVGSNDGEQHDHLRPIILTHEWRGVMVEPLPFVFERLRENYAPHERVALENVAIAEEDGSRTFFHLREASPQEADVLPSWYDGIGSFSRETVLSHERFIPDIADRLVETRVPCLTFESLCRRHRIGLLDVLLIDTEGYDAQVLDLVDFQAHSPRLLVFEHYHLSKDRYGESCERLARAGYGLMAEGFDTWCLGPRATPVVHEVFSVAEPVAPALFAQDESR